jgi:hypothetical protein
VPVKVKETLEVLGFDSSLSLYPGKTIEFPVTVEKYASLSYNSSSLIFQLNNMAYQNSYVVFSSDIYEDQLGTNTLSAWFL